ncbi:MAG: AMIN domain-containing protein, partial [Gemmatimonadota bacterium]|nr:AMIN domain-containing protein [Gemmatimonadota bacterium]
MTSIFAIWAGAALAFSGPVTAVTITPSATMTSVLIAVEGDVEYRDFAMEGPHRLVVDIMGGLHSLPRDNFYEVNRGGIRAVRTSQYSDDIVRIVFELENKIGYSVLQEPRGIRISMDNAGGPFEAWSSGDGSRPAPSTRSAPVAAPPPVVETGSTLRRSNTAQSRAPRVTMTFSSSPIQEVLQAFAAFSGKSIVPGGDVTGLVTATITNQPWDVALGAILATQGLVGEEDDYGIIRVDNVTSLNERELVEPIETRAHRI